MDPVRPAYVIAEREESDMVHDGLAAATLRVGIAGAAHHVGGFFRLA